VPERIAAHAPGRVNLIGDHTDYAQGLVLPMAIDLGTTVTLRPGGTVVELTSADDREPAVVAIDSTDTPSEATPAWARYVAGVVASVRPRSGGLGNVTSTLPIGAGLSSSAALEVALALALGCQGNAVEVARLCQRAEHLASGVPCGIMDQLCVTAGVAGHALLIDCRSLAVTPVPVPPDAEVVVVHSGRARTLVGSAYAERRAAVEAAAATLGLPLRDAVQADVAGLTDPVLRRRARHVVTENARVRSFAAALTAGDLPGAGALMVESHASLRDDFDVSTPELDALVEDLSGSPGVLGARLTGAGFGGCGVALVERGAGQALVTRLGPSRAWVVRPSAGASVDELSP
jgi:galactokinase